MNSGESYLHSGGAYHLKGTDSSRLMYWLPGETYGDVAVEVTAREIGAAQDDGVGLILRVDASDTNRVTFFVDRTGFWLLSSYHCCQKNPDDDWTALNGGWNAAIHIGSGAANTLLVVMHGNSFICYVNGHFVGSDTVDRVPSTGEVGIYMNTSATESVLSNFSVYPLPTTCRCWYRHTISCPFLTVSDRSYPSRRVLRCSWPPNIRHAAHRT